MPKRIKQLAARAEFHYHMGLWSFTRVFMCFALSEFAAIAMKAPQLTGVAVAAVVLTCNAISALWFAEKCDPVRCPFRAEADAKTFLIDKDGDDVNHGCEKRRRHLALVDAARKSTATF